MRSFAAAGAGRAHGLGDVEGIRSRLPHLAGLGVDALWITPWYPRRWPTAGTTSPTTATSTPGSARSTTSARSSPTPRPRPAGAGRPGAPPHLDRAPLVPRGPVAVRAAPRPRRRSAQRLDLGVRRARLDPAAGVGPVVPAHLRPRAARPGLVERGGAAPLRRRAAVLARPGVDGLRVDAVPAIGKDLALPDAGHEPGALFASSSWVGSPQWDGDWVTDVVERWRRWSTSTRATGAGQRVGGGRARAGRAVRRARAGCTPRSTSTTCTPRGTRRAAAVVDTTLAALAPTGAPATWVLSNHDETRHVTRFGRRSTGVGVMGFDAGEPSDLVLGLRRARAAALLMLALPGSAYLYQGEELGLPEVTDLPEELLQDPTWERSGHTSRGRDGCRVPLPWSGTRRLRVRRGPPVAAPAGVVGRADRAGAGRRPGLHADPLPRTPAAAPGAAGGEELGWDDAPPQVLSFTRGRACAAWSTWVPSRCRWSARSCWPAGRCPAASCPRTPPPG